MSNPAPHRPYTPDPHGCSKCKEQRPLFEMRGNCYTGYLCEEWVVGYFENLVA